MTHELSPACPCGPAEEVGERNGERWFMFVHASLDGRELAEV